MRIIVYVQFLSCSTRDNDSAELHDQYDMLYAPESRPKSRNDIRTSEHQIENNAQESAQDVVAPFFVNLCTLLFYLSGGTFYMVDVLYYTNAMHHYMG